MIDLSWVELFARAGGGGSGGGGSGGGGAYILALPATFGGLVSLRIKKKFRSSVASFIVGMIVMTIVSLFLIPMGVWIWLISFVLGIIGVWGGANHDLIGKFRKNRQQATAVVSQASMADSVWDQQGLINYATAVFNRFQYDWQMMDLTSIQQYTTVEYAKHIGLMLYAMQQMGRRNEMQNIKVIEAVITNAKDSANNTEDTVSVAFVANMDDYLIETVSGKMLRVSSEDFGEQWNFVRNGDKWLLDSIDQGTEEGALVDDQMRQFARANSMFFSPDWGNLLLPNRGVLFKQGFNRTDINNHIIGYWQGDLLVQLYTYANASESNKVVNYYIIGQITLPKSYGGIIVERKGVRAVLRLFAPKGYEKMTLEWADFNKRYRVYATRPDLVASLELLNPAFMTWLYDQDLKVNIEVVDNTVYLYSGVSQGEDRYAEMMEVLKRSYRELKL